MCLYNCISGLISPQVLCLTLLGLIALATAAAAPICRAGQPTLDSDNDGICDALEVVLGTDPKKADSDGDGISYAFLRLYSSPSDTFESTNGLLHALDTHPISCG